MCRLKSYLGHQVNLNFELSTQAEIFGMDGTIQTGLAGEFYCS
jgi:hypothetical protein